MMPAIALKSKSPERSRALFGLRRLPSCANWASIFSGHRSKHVDEFEGQHFDYVITVCDNAKESCPVFMDAAKRLHHSFDDPPPASQGSYEERMAIFRRVRDELRAYLRNFASEVKRGQ